MPKTRDDGEEQEQGFRIGAVSRLRPRYLVCDGTVPRTKLPEALAAVKRVSKKYDLPIGNVFRSSKRMRGRKSSSPHSLR